MNRGTDAKQDAEQTRNIVGADLSAGFCASFAYKFSVGLANRSDYGKEDFNCRR